MFPSEEQVKSVKQAYWSRVIEEGRAWGMKRFISKTNISMLICNHIPEASILNGLGEEREKATK